MGRARYGVFGPIQGSVKNLVFYMSKGQSIVRTIGLRHDKPSEKVKANCQSIRLLNYLFRPLKAFLKMGFSHEAKGTTMNYYNMAMSCNKINAIEIDGQQATINYEKVVFSMGSGLAAQNPTVELISSGLKFTWDHDATEHWEARNDRVMLMAYFPEENEAIYTLSGARRSEGTDKLDVHPQYLNKRMEIYISFASNNGDTVARSIYIGRLN